MSANRRLRVIEGRPWREALVCALAPEAPYQPWHGLDEVRPGDTAVVVIATDPPTVLCAFAIGAEPVRQAIAARWQFTGTPLRTVDEVERASGGLHLAHGPPVDFQAAETLIAAVDDYAVGTPDQRVGTDSVAGGRILLQSEGRCTCCHAAVDLAHTAAGDLSLHLVSEADFADGRDWPALLCPACTREMALGGFDSVIDYAYSRQPACPACSARRTREVSYGMPTYDWHLNKPPWIGGGGCVVGSSGRWQCGECGHSWGSATGQVPPDELPLLNTAARRLFAEWTGVTNPELLAALWNNLNDADRRFWLDRAGE